MEAYGKLWKLVEISFYLQKNVLPCYRKKCFNWKFPEQLILVNILLFLVYDIIDFSGKDSCVPHHYIRTENFD